MAVVCLEPARGVWDCHGGYGTMEVLAFGEILWDVYPQERTLGGAPFNFSAHLSRLGTQVGLVSAVGEDMLGRRTRAALRDYRVDDRFVHTVHRPTGVCQVTLSPEGTPSYTLRDDMAYDAIRLEQPQLEQIGRSGCRALYFGTLAQRSAVSRATLQALLTARHYEEILFDVNIRQPFYTREVVARGLSACTILKCSREEAGVFARLGLVRTNCAGVDARPSSLQVLCRELAFRYAIQTVLVTMDKDGALAYDAASDCVCCSDPPTGRAVSTVGAGDSFSACYLHYQLQGAPIWQCLRKAVLLSDYVVGHIDSVPLYSPQLLQRLRQDG